MPGLQAKDRLIVALDVPSFGDARALVERLGDTVGFYKIGWELFLTGELPRLLEQLAGKSVFLDLKVPGDIGNTIRSAVERAAAMGVRFLTLSDSVPRAAIVEARRARGAADHPKLLMVPFLSSLDASDLTAALRGKDLNETIAERAGVALAAGCDGLIASGEAIGVLRQRFPETLIVSPGIRPAGSAADDHKRLTTPAEAIRLGSDYLVVGRPIRTDPDPRQAAQRIIDEIDRARVVARKG